jgi:hypothetical protein
MNLDARGIDDPMYSTMTGTPGGGSGGTNKYSPYVMNDLKHFIYDISRQPLTGGEEIHELDLNVSESFAKHLGGASTLDYLSRCALNDGDWVSTGVHTEYGEGILTTTTEWKSQGLDLPASEDLFSCLLAHLNPFNEEVPIFLSGKNVQVDGGFDASPYIYEEALWVTEINTMGPTIHFYVWPLGDLQTLCTEADPSIQGIVTRVCGTMDASECGVTVHESLDACDIDDTTGFYTCLGRPAIKTKLRAVDMPTIYPSCFPP